MPIINSRRIAKNTFFLYIRMLLLMAVSLYTTRAVLASLGVDDYGIYQLMAGFISLFSIISHSLVSAIQRFFNIALGKNDRVMFGKIYSTGIVLLFFLSILLFLFGETIGLWFIKTQLNIPPGREKATFWVYQISIFNLFVTLFRTPDNAAIIAHERMSFYAFLSIAEAILKLGIVFLLSCFGLDKLISYTVLLLGATVLINIIYKVYCFLSFSYCRFHLIWEKRLTEEMLSFSWWTLIGKGVQLGTLQGENFFLNHYHTVAVNAARGVAAQVYNAINTFLANFQMAFRPQLVQTYVADDKTEHHKLLYRSARMSFYLLILLIVPIVFNMDVLLSLWLKDVPKYTKEFCVFVLFAYLIDALSTPLASSVSANGNIKGNQLLISFVFILQLISSFLALKMGAVPYIVSFFILCSHALMFLSYLYYAHKLCSVSYKVFLKEVLWPCFMVLFFSFMIPFLISAFTDGVTWAFISILCSLLWVMIVVWILGITKAERQLVGSIINSKIRGFIANER